jgi:hypothetical protein
MYFVIMGMPVSDFGSLSDSSSQAHKAVAACFLPVGHNMPRWDDLWGRDLSNGPSFGIRKPLGQGCSWASAPPHHHLDTPTAVVSWPLTCPEGQQSGKPSHALGDLLNTYLSVVSVSSVALGTFL